MQITLYNIPILDHTKNNSITFTDKTNRTAFFNGWFNKKALVDKNVHIENIWKLNNTITIFDELREPYANYNYLSIDDEHYFYITDFKELGNNQIEYSIRKDTLITYVTSPNSGVDVTNRKALVIREHKPRFDFVNNKPIFDRELEDINVEPEVTTLEETKTPSRTRLVLRKYGGGKIDQEVLSHVKYFWQVFTQTQQSISWGIGKLDINIPLGWAVNSTTNSSTDITFKTYDKGGVARTLVIKGLQTDEYIVFRKDLTANRYLLAGLKDGNYFDLQSKVLGGTPNPDFYEYHANNLYIYLNLINNDNMQINVSGDFINIYADMRIRLQEDLPTNKNLIVRKSNQSSTLVTDLFDEIKRFDPMNTKIIELPYLPDFSTTKVLGIDTTSIVLMEALTNVYLNTQTFTVPSKTFDMTKVDKNKVALNDPKIYTSQFRPHFLTWYGDSIPIKREMLQSDQITFKMAINEADYSKVKITETSTYDKKEPYELTRVIALNNEVATMSSELDTYMKYLYDNDIKMIRIQERQANRQLAQSGLNIPVNAAAGAGMGMLGANPATAVIGATVGAAKGSIDFGFNVANHMDARRQRKLEYENKITQMQVGLINIAGASPELNALDGSDALKLWRITPTDKHLEYLDEYFYRYGYQTLEIKKPTLRTRKYFDYKQMLIDEISSGVVNLETKADIINRFNDGVTLFHANLLRETKSGTMIQNQTFPIDYNFMKNNAPYIVHILFDGNIFDVYATGNNYISFDIGAELTVYSDGTWVYDGDYNDVNNKEIEILFEHKNHNFDYTKENWEL